MKEYIEKYILPYDTYANQLSYEKGELEYDIDYVKEHMKYNESFKFLKFYKDFYEEDGYKWSLKEVEQKLKEDNIKEYKI